MRGDYLRSSWHVKLTSYRGIPTQNLDRTAGAVLRLSLFLISADHRRGYVSRCGLWHLVGYWRGSDCSVGTHHLEGTAHPSHDPRTGPDHARGGARRNRLTVSC